MFQRMYTASLEKFKIQCNSVVLVFKPREFTKVPNELVGFVMEQVKNRGVFLVPDDVEFGSKEFKKRERDALITYMGIWLKERIVNYLAQQDDYRRRGVTLLADAKYERAIRWEKELRERLEMEAPIEEELSFLEAKRTENTVIEKKIEEASFIEAKPEATDKPVAKKRGRPFSKKPLEVTV